MADDDAPRILVIEARFYEDIADELVRGAADVLEQAGARWDRVAVPGVFEVPAALSMAVEAMENGGPIYDGFVVLGCVIRGETTHYDIVAGESGRAILDLAIDECLALGNGILTVENSEQAWARARVSGKNWGGKAAAAALAMVRLKRSFGLDA